MPFRANIYLVMHIIERDGQGAMQVPALPGIELASVARLAISNAGLGPHFSMSYACASGSVPMGPMLVLQDRDSLLDTTMLVPHSQ
jgi:hypothetical protein